MAFKVGDRVVLRADADDYGGVDDLKLGDEGVIRTVTTGDDDDYKYEMVREDGEYEFFKEQQLSLVSKKGFLMSLTSRVRNLALSKEVRLRRKHGVVNDCGERTSEGTELLLDLLFEAHLPEIDKKLQEVEAEDKAEKK